MKHILFAASTARTSVPDLVTLPVTSPSMNHVGRYIALISLGWRVLVPGPGLSFSRRDPTLSGDDQSEACLTASSLERANGRAGFYMQRISVPSP